MRSLPIAVGAAADQKGKRPPEPRRPAIKDETTAAPGAAAGPNPQEAPQGGRTPQRRDRGRRGEQDQASAPGKAIVVVCCAESRLMLSASGSTIVTLPSSRAPIAIVPPIKAADEALDHERPADEPVGGADQPHHLDLGSPRVDRETDRVADQQQRRDHQQGRRPRASTQRIAVVAPLILLASSRESPMSRDQRADRRRLAARPGRRDRGPHAGEIGEIVGGDVERGRQRIVGARKLGDDVPPVFLLEAVAEDLQRLILGDELDLTSRAGSPGAWPGAAVDASGCVERRSPARKIRSPTWSRTSLVLPFVVCSTGISTRAGAR